MIPEQLQPLQADQPTPLYYQLEIALRRCIEAGDFPDGRLPTEAELTSKMDFHGIGETLVPAAPAAIGCAVANAIGVRPHGLPLTPERILRALQEKGR